MPRRQTRQRSDSRGSARRDTGSRPTTISPSRTRVSRSQSLQDTVTGSQSGDSARSPSSIERRASRKTRITLRQKNPPGPIAARGHPVRRKVEPPQPHARPTYTIPSLFRSGEKCGSVGSVERSPSRFRSTRGIYRGKRPLGNSARTHIPRSVRTFRIARR